MSLPLMAVLLATSKAPWANPMFSARYCFLNEVSEEAPAWKVSGETRKRVVAKLRGHSDSKDYDMKVVRMVIRFLFVVSCLSLLALWGVAACFPLFNRSSTHAVSLWIALSLAIIVSLYDMKLYYLKNIKSDADQVVEE